MDMFMLIVLLFVIFIMGRFNLFVDYLGKLNYFWYSKYVMYIINSFKRNKIGNLNYSECLK